MKTYKLKSKYFCLIKSADFETMLEPSQTLEVETNENLMVYPIGKGRAYLPFTVDTKNLKNSTNYSYASLGEEVLICFSDAAKCSSYTIERKNIGGSEFVYEIGQESFSAAYKNWKKTFALSDYFDSYKTGSKNDIAYIFFSNARKKSLYAFNIKNGNARHFEGDDITITPEGFSTTLTYGNTKNSKEYKIDAQGLKTSKVSGDYKISNPQTVAYHFLDALKNNDYDSAYDLCNPKLQNQISKSNLKNFFGALADFFSLDAYKYAVLSGNELKIYLFDIVNEKIDEIEQL